MKLILNIILKVLKSLSIISDERVWNIQYRLGFWDYLDKERSDDILSILDQALSTHSNVLEFGCGFGTLSRHFEGKFQHWTGYDISDSAVAIANNKAPDHCSFHQGDMRYWSRDPKKDYDLIILEEVIYYLESDEQDRFLEECKKAIEAHKGQILVTLHDRQKFRDLIEKLTKNWQMQDLSKEGNRALLLMNYHQDS